MSATAVSEEADAASDERYSRGIERGISALVIAPPEQQADARRALALLVMGRDGSRDARERALVDVMRVCVDVIKWK